MKLGVRSELSLGTKHKLTVTAWRDGLCPPYTASYPCSIPKHQVLICACTPTGPLYLSSWMEGQCSSLSTQLHHFFLSSFCAPGCARAFTSTKADPQPCVSLLPPRPLPRGREHFEGFPTHILAKPRTRHVSPRLGPGLDEQGQGPTRANP